MWFLVAQAAAYPDRLRLKGCQKRAWGCERGVGSYFTSESCCAVGMAGFEGERISTPLAVA